MVDAVPELHRPWLDDILIRCPRCAQSVRRIPEVGDCWLDAGIVPFSTLGYLEDREQWERWFPADFIVEAVGQLRGWFYAMLFMSTALEGTSPYRTVLAHERVLASDGREMHKSWGNAVWLDDALDKMGPDVIRHMFASQAITEPIRFGFEAARDVTRRFLTFWNVYSLFVTYANLDRPRLLEPDERSSGRGTAGTVAAESAAGYDRRGPAGLRHVSDPPGRHRGRFVHPRRSVELVRATTAARVLERRSRPREAGGLPGALPRPRAGVPAARPRHAVHHRTRLPEPCAHRVAGCAYRASISPRSRSPTPRSPDPTWKPTWRRRGGCSAWGWPPATRPDSRFGQPLGRALLVAPPDVERAVRAFEADILDELNVERLETVPASTHCVAVSASSTWPDTSTLPPNAVPSLRAALAARTGRDRSRRLARRRPRHPPGGRRRGQARVGEISSSRWRAETASRPRPTETSSSRSTPR